MNLFDLGGKRCRQMIDPLIYSVFVGQHLRVGKAITPPEGLFGSAPGAAAMPQATALAAATITAQLQSKEGDVVVTPPIGTVVGAPVVIFFLDQNEFESKNSISIL